MKALEWEIQHLTLNAIKFAVTTRNRNLLHQIIESAAIRSGRDYKPSTRIWLHRGCLGHFQTRADGKCLVGERMSATFRKNRA